MKKCFFIAMFFLVLTISPKAAGVGIVLGQPYSVALSLSSGNAKYSYDLAVSWVNSGLYLHASYLISTFIISRNLPLYAGLGVRTNIREGNPDLGIRIPLGMRLFFSRIEVFAEIVPSFMILPDMYFISNPSASYGIGVRYHFDI